jgi:hypothetical protein
MQGSRARASALAAFAVVWVACGESIAPGGEQPTAPGILTAAGDGRCSFREAQSFARAYFPAPEPRSTVRGLIQAMEAAGAGSATATAAGFQVFGYIAAGRNAGPASAGADLTLELIDCMDVTVSETRSLREVLISALTNYAYAVVGTADANEAAVVAENGLTGVCSNLADLSDGCPGGVGNFHQWIGGQGLVYAGTLASPPAFAETALAGPFRWGLVFDNNQTDGPDPSIDDAITVALCAANALADNQRVGRQHASQQAVSESVLQFATVDWLTCPPAAAAAPTASSAAFAAWTREALAALLPRPLHAQGDCPECRGGGQASDFSDFAIVDPGTSIVLAYTTQPVDGFTNTPIAVVVCAETAKGTPLENVGITLTIAGNEGTNVVLTGGTETVTDESGCAAFSISINKPGGYRLDATTDFVGFAVTTLTSNLFNLQQNP